MGERSPNKKIRKSVGVNVGARQAVPGVQTMIMMLKMVMLMAMMVIKMVVMVVVMLMFTQTGLQSYLLLTPVGPEKVFIVNVFYTNTFR